MEKPNGGKGDSDSGDVGTWLKRRRESLGLKLEEVAARAGMSKSTAHRVEQPGQTPGKKSAARIAEALGVPPLVLLAVTRTPPLDGLSPEAAEVAVLFDALPAGNRRVVMRLVQWMAAAAAAGCAGGGKRRAGTRNRE